MDGLSDVRPGGRSPLVGLNLGKYYAKVVVYGGQQRRHTCCRSAADHAKQDGRTAIGDGSGQSRASSGGWPSLR